MVLEVLHGKESVVRFPNSFTGGLALHHPACLCFSVSDGGKGHRLDFGCFDGWLSIISCFGTKFARFPDTSMLACDQLLDPAVSCVCVCV